MYDLEVIIPVTTCSFKYSQRLADFKKYGLLNTGSHKIILRILTGNENIDNIDKDWPPNVTVDIINCERKDINCNNVVSKLYAYYFDRDVSEWKSSRWFMRVDDDSTTDVKELINTLDKYDYKKEWYFATEYLEGDTKIEVDLMKSMGYEDLFPKGQKLLHELEACVLSQAAAYKIFTNPEARSVIEARIPISKGWTDICLAGAAQLAQVYPINAYFLSGHPYVGDFSLFGGSLNHIHFVASDKNKEAFACIVNAIESTSKIKKEFIPLTIGEYLFGRNPNVPISVIKFKGASDKNFGFIENSQNENEKLWKIVDNELYFLNTLGLITSVFPLEGDLNYIKGNYILDPKNKVGHFLRRLT